MQLARFGSSFFTGEVSLHGEGITLSQKPLTAFVERIDPQRNDVRKSEPPPALSGIAPEFSEPPGTVLGSDPPVDTYIEIVASFFIDYACSPGVASADAMSVDPIDPAVDCITFPFTP